MKTTWNYAALILIAIGCTFPEILGWVSQAIGEAIRNN